MNYYKWNYDKNKKLKAERDLSFEQVIMHIEGGNLLDIVTHPNQSKYPNQQILVVEINNYVYLVPFVEDETGKFLKTIIPSRKATRDYLGGSNNGK
ncbi:MAG: BrnT family toxin [Desulfamplus sp.]|nr:BrnT family toxin [Desulfamplus sp.]